MAVDTQVRTSPEQLARALVESVADRKADDIVLLDLRDISIISDFFVLCTGGTERQINTLLRALLDRAAEMGVESKRIEGTSDGGWILIDFGDVIAHVFSPQQRAFYRLDELWKDARPLLVIQ
ncbi:MAG: ribosome silencing factor [Chloroflexota bacterium]|nr:ribosome silencing factor [Chloroflexota bacterium]